MDSAIDTGKEVVVAKPFELVEVDDPSKVTVIASPLFKAIDNTGVVVYVWKHGKAMFLSKKNWTIAEEFIKTSNYERCALKLFSEMRIKLSLSVIKNRLERQDMKDYIAEQMEERGMYAGWTREHWLAVMTRHIQGISRLANGDLYAMKLIASVRGWEVPLAQTNVQINFTERAA